MSWDARLLRDIDTGRLHARTHRVARRLAEHHRCAGAVGAEIVTEFDAGRATGNEALSNKLWQIIESLSADEQGALRTLVSLLRSDEPIDSHLAEYLIGWAQQEGLPAEKIEAAFRAS